MRGPRILTKTGALFILGFVLVPFLPGAESGGPFRSYNLPLAEIQRVLSQWFRDAGFAVSLSTPNADQVHLTAVKENESWQVVLKPNSPLASSLQAEFFRQGKPDPKRAENLWAFLDGYARGAASGGGDSAPGVPPAVLSRADSVVCLQARSGRVEIQFSGFIVDRKGTILSTAHDLQGVEELTVMLPDGREMKGQPVKRDLHRDLALIRVKSDFPTQLELAKRKSLLRDGEKVYAICYTGKQEKKILSGTLTGPIRRSDRLPLWQVNMDTPPGSSGSPVFDEQGNLVSVVKGRYRENHAVGFLIPLWTVMEFLEER